MPLGASGLNGEVGTTREGRDRPKRLRRRWSPELSRILARWHEQRDETNMQRKDGEEHIITLQHYHSAAGKREVYISRRFVSCHLR